MSTASQRVSVSVVVPAFHSADSLPALYQRLERALAEDYPAFELLLVDDGSLDQTWDVIRQLAASDPRVKGIRLSRRFGQHPAIAAAFDRALGEAIVLMDADLEDRPEDVPKLLARLGRDVDIAYTLKVGGGSSLVTRVTSFIFHQLFARIANTRIPGEVGTLRAFNRKVLDALKRHPEYDVFFGSLMFFVGFSAAFVPVTRDPRPHGASNYTFLKRLSLAARTLASYTNLPHYSFFLMGATVVLGVVLYTIVILIQTLVYGVRLPPGFTLLALLLMFFMGVTMVSLGVIGSYVFLVYQEVLRRPRYLVAEETADNPASDTAALSDTRVGPSP